MHFPYKKINSSGFTLVELIASLAILSMVIAVFLPIFPQIVSWTKKADDELIASNLLSQVAHDVKELPDMDDLASSIKGCPDVMKIKDERLGDVSSYTINNQTYHVKVKICKESNVDLYRTNLLIFSSSNKMISESYTYIELENEGEN
ncbi:type II secretion system protein [Virgibacillus flavescens]|uniref:type II secretion system protein n=1 Tax=Virgibacillus flavescens TaxID=1611422 RepID=UPI003D3271C9